MAHLKILATIALSALLTLAVLLFAVYLIFKVYRLVKFTDVPMLLSIISIALASLCLLVFCILDIISFFIPQGSFLDTNAGGNFIETFDRLKVLFLYCSFVFDLYKWCIFIAATEAKVDIERLKKR